MTLADRPILALMVAETVIWAALFYSFPALVLDWEAEFGWTRPQIMGAFTAAILTYALAAPLAGSLIDRARAPLLMPLAALIGALCLAALTLVQSLAAFYALWIVIGVTMGGTLYEAAFALVTRIRRDTARAAITAITLCAGFASTLAYPLIHVISGSHGWRVALITLAALVALVALPLFAYAARRLEAQLIPDTPEPDAPRPTHHLRRPAFWLVASGFALTALATSLVISHIFPLLRDRGVDDATAVFAASMIGPMQVAGRLAILGAGTRLPNMAILLAAFGAMGAGLMCLTLTTGGPALLAGFVLLMGSGYGVVSILRPLIVRDLLGQRNFGAISGAVAFPTLLMTAAAPALGALVAARAGYTTVLALCVLSIALGAATLLAARKLT